MFTYMNKVLFCSVLFCSTKQNSIWSKALIMPLCFVLQTEELFQISTRIISVKISLFFQEITSITEFPGSNFLLPTFLIGGKWDFQVANLQLSTVISNPENIFHGDHGAKQCII